ncbi:MAG: ATP-binding cassette domain-containing protein [Proteobacteria bacterium]|nr:ATP-binding cassette domain-containing protein [Pseudomonadota bacterium]
MRRRSDLGTVLKGGAVALVVLGVAPFFLDIYTVNILIRALLLAVLALTVDLLWGYTGILTFGQSAFFGIGAYACALVFTHWGFGAGWAILALLLGILGAMAVAALAGWLAFYHGAAPLYGSIVTLALPIVLTQVVYAGGRTTGSSSGLSGFPTYYWSNEIWFWIVGTFLVLVTMLAWLFVHSDMGRVLVAIKENETRCAYLGIPVSRIKILLFVVAGAIGAIAGFGYAAFTNVVAPELTGFLLGTELLIWVALGGRGTLIGPVIGAILIEMTSSYLSGSLPFYWKLLIGILFVVVIVALPQGLMPEVTKLWRRLVPGAGRKTETPEIVPVPVREVARGTDQPLVVRDLHRHFGSLQVLQGINFVANEGELLSLVGPNGAGKTTLIRCLADGFERSGGDITIFGKDLGRWPPNRCVALGIGRKFQVANVFATLTVAECLRVARYRLDPPSVWARDTTLGLPEAARRIVEETGLAQSLDTEARHLAHGQKQALELAMVLALEPRIVLLDEPTAGLTRIERERIGAILTSLIERERLSILLVEHDLDFVREISSRVIVLHQGRIVLDGSVEEVVGSELVRNIYTGTMLDGGDDGS